jgi:SAM-dependent methyltransferase
VTPAEYWASNEKLQHITPLGERFPEVNLFPALQKAIKGSVFEYGCGDGRLAPAFNPDQYVGYDINYSAIKAARLNNPAYQYTDAHAIGYIYHAYTFLAYTVLLHVPDYEIENVIGLAKKYNRIVIGEIMGRQWRRPGNPPVFNRELSDYAEMIQRPYEVINVQYPRYGCDLTLAVFDESLRS